MGTSLHQFHGKEVEPVKQRACLTPGYHCLRVGLDQSGGAFEITGCEGVCHRLADHSPLFKPAACPSMKLRTNVRLFMLQATAKHGCEKLMVAVAFPALIERNGEEVVPLEHGQSLHAAGLPRDLITQEPVQPAKD